MTGLIIGATGANNTDTSTDETSSATDAKAAADAKQAESKPKSAAPKDTTESASDDDDSVDTRDKGWVGKLTDGVKSTAGTAARATKKAWELTADAQQKTNSRPRNWKEKAITTGGGDVHELRNAEARKDGDEFWQDAGEKTGISRQTTTLVRDVHREAGWGAEDADEGINVASAGADIVGGLDVARSTADNAGWVRGLSNRNAWGAAIKVVEDDQALEKGAAGAASKTVGRVALGYTAATSGIAIYEDVTDEDGPSWDLAKPIGDLGANVIGYFGGPIGASFGAGYAVGGVINDYTGVQDAMDGVHDRSIARRSQIGFLADRAQEMDLSAAARIRTGTHTDDDALRARTVLREAREHGILDQDGTVHRDAIVKMMPRPIDSGSANTYVTTGEAVSADAQSYLRVERGILRALELERREGTR